VVFRHLSIGMQRAGIAIDPHLFTLIDEVGLSFRMPLFFLLSGIFFRKSVEKRSRGGYLVHKSKTILYPYLLWSFIITSLQIILSSYSNTQAELINYLHIFIQPWGHWWFLYALFNVSALYLLMHLLGRGAKGLLLGIGLALYFTAPYLQGYSVLQDIFSLFVFFALGDLMAKGLLSTSATPLLQSGKLMICLGIGAIIGEGILFQQLWGKSQALLLLVALLGSGFTILLSYRLALWQHPYLRFIRTVGQHSLYIYLLHAPVGAAVRALFLQGAGINTYWIIMLFALPAGIFLPIFIYRFCLKLGLQFLFAPPQWGKSSSLSPVNT
jgi:uncharacterized membrane protein YcfT